MVQNILPKILLGAAVLTSTVNSFSPHHSHHSFQTRQKQSGNANVDKTIRLKAQLTDDDSYLSKFFTGGAFDNAEEDAIKIASKIRSVKDLGWTKPAKRAGNMRPRHRSFGGQDESPVQLKAGYDESKEKCPEKWLTEDEFYAKTRSSGPAADTVFVALAGGGAFAERDVVEKRILEWRGADGKIFSEKAFLASVKKGRFDLGAGWAIFLSASVGAASCIILPTNPISKGLEGLIDAALR